MRGILRGTETDPLLYNEVIVIEFLTTLLNIVLSIVLDLLYQPFELIIKVYRLETLLLSRDL